MACGQPLLKPLYLLGAPGLPSIALFTLVSKGAISESAGSMSLLILLVCFVLVFREASPKYNA